MFVLVIALFLILFSCAKPVVNLSYIKPPERYSGDIRKIAVLPFDSRSLDGRLFASEVEAELSKARVGGIPYFTLVAREDIEKVFQELKLSTSGLTKEVHRAGELLPAEGILTGRVDYSYNVSRYSEKRFKCTETKGGGLIKECVRTVEYYVPCERHSLVLLLIPKLIEVESGKIVYTRRIEVHRSADRCSDESRAVSFSELLSSAKRKAIRELLRDIAPFRVTLRAEFIDDDEDVRDKESFERALELVKEGKAEKACSLFEEIEGSSYSLLFNRGLCAELRGELETARKFYERALSLRKDKRIEEALARVLERERDEERLKALIK